MALVHVTDTQTMTLVSGTTDTGNLDFTFDLGSYQKPNLDGFVSFGVKTELTAGSDLTPIVLTAVPIISISGANQVIDTSQAISLNAAFTMVDDGHFQFPIEDPFAGAYGLRFSADVSGLTATTGVKFTVNMAYS